MSKYKVTKEGHVIEKYDDAASALARAAELRTMVGNQSFYGVLDENDDPFPQRPQGVEAPPEDVDTSGSGPADESPVGEAGQDDPPGDSEEVTALPSEVDTTDEDAESPFDPPVDL